MPGIRREAFEKSGIHKLSNRSDFFTRLEECKAFISSKGRIPNKNSTDEFERSLHHWRLDQMKSHNLGRIKGHRLELLLQSGVLESSYILEWRSFYDRLKAFVNTHGRLPSRDDSKNKKECTLGVWCSRQRRLNKSGKLNPERMKPLEDLGLFRNRWNDIWLAHYKEVYQYLRKNGKLPEHDTIDPVERQLGRWCKYQKKEYARNKLSKERITLLRTAGII